jgi:glutathione S-transferase
MRLLGSPRSPYVRKVRVAAAELGLDVEHDPTDPWADPADLLAANPIGKVPTLVTDDDQALFDSRVILAFLDQLSGGRLYPPGEAQWPVRRREAIAEGILDAAVASVIEGRRPEAQRSADWLRRQKSVIARALAALAAEADELDRQPLADRIAVACALGYLDFRMPEMVWRQTHGGLADWHAGFGARPSMRATVPVP